MICFQNEHLECHTSNIGGVSAARKVKYFKQRATARFSNNLFVARLQKVARFRMKALKNQLFFAFTTKDELFRELIILI